MAFAIIQAAVNPDEIELDGDSSVVMDVAEKAVPDAVYGDAKKALATQAQEGGALARFKKAKSG